MIPDEKISQIVEQLLRKSRSNEVNWVPESGAFSGTSYLVRFPRASIRITYVSPSAEPDFVRIDLYGKSGESVGRIRAEEGAPGFDMLLELYQHADRSVRKWDIALEEIEKAVTAEGPIGLVPDDVPF